MKMDIHQFERIRKRIKNIEFGYSTSHPLTGLDHWLVVMEILPRQLTFCTLQGRSLNRLFYFILARVTMARMHFLQLLYS